MRYKALTWDHPRGLNALVAAAENLDEARHGIAIDWEKQPLEGFESHPIGDLCSRYDIVIIDHPHVGEAVEGGCLTPLEDVLPASAIEQVKQNTIGPSFESYFFSGQHWALPLDSATQVMAARIDLLSGNLPKSWQQVLEYGRQHGKLLLSLAGPHAVLTYFSLCAAQRNLRTDDNASVLFDQSIAVPAIEMLLELARFGAPQSYEWNPIEILTAMSETDDFVLCPLVFGYVNYSDPRSAKPVRFFDAPAWGNGQRPGSTLGGTGIAITRRCKVTPQLIEHLLWLMSENVQHGLIPSNQGQPSRRSAWFDPSVNQFWGGFYRETAKSIESAFIRPRYSGYISFQTQASQVLRDELAGGGEPVKILTRLRNLFVQSYRSGQ
ncbi:MAG: ABC transporter substrate-binding protein [Pseudomonadota bacterium]